MHKVHTNRYKNCIKPVIEEIPIRDYKLSKYIETYMKDKKPD